MKNEDKIVELLTQLVQKQDQLIERMDSKEVADQRRSLKGLIDDISFILERFIEWNSTKKTIVVDKREFSVYFTALKTHLNELFTMFDELDAE
jgi:hypothetical protein